MRHGDAPFPVVPLPHAGAGRAVARPARAAERRSRYTLRVPFAYFDRLSPEEKLVYRVSDAITSMRLAGVRELTPVVAAVDAALARGDRRSLERAAARLVHGICSAFETRPPRVEILEVRPSFTGGELHGLYTQRARGRPTIQVWMRTARYGRVVAFRTFVRTLLHEIGHHLDFHVLRLPLSFHTEGFFRRESSLYHQLLPDAPRRRPRPERAS